MNRGLFIPFRICSIVHFLVEVGKFVTELSTGQGLHSEDMWGAILVAVAAKCTALAFCRPVG